MTLTLTPSNAIILSQCQKRFETINVKKQYPSVKSTRSSVLAFGNACHRALRDLYDPSLPGLLPHRENLQIAIRMAFLREIYYKDEGGREHDMNRAHRLISRYLDEDEDAVHTKAVELAGTFPIKIGEDVGFFVSARLDRIIVRPSAPDVLVCRDYKLASSLRALDPIQIYLNLCVAKLAHKGAYKRYVLELVNLTDDGAEMTEYHSADVKGVHRHVVSLVRRYEAATEFLPSPSEHCVYCPLLAECQGGNAPASLDDIAFND